MEYRGFKTQPEFDGTIFFGKLENISDLVTIESPTLEEFETAFKDAVDDYIKFRQSLSEQSKAG